MSNEVKIPAEVRSRSGSADSRRMRWAGKVPAVVYGLGKDPVNVTVSAEHIRPVVQAGGHVVDLTVNGQEEKAIIRDVQWDTYMAHLLHVDFQRVDPNARVDIDVEIEVRGQVTTGVMDHHLHSLRLNCVTYQIPDKIVVKVGTLKIGDAITIGQLALPPTATFSLPADTVVVKVHEAKAVDIVLADARVGEPEVIAKKKAEEAAE